MIEGVAMNICSLSKEKCWESISPSIVKWSKRHDDNPASIIAKTISSKFGITSDVGFGYVVAIHINEHFANLTIELE